MKVIELINNFVSEYNHTSHLIDVNRTVSYIDEQENGCEVVNVI